MAKERKYSRKERKRIASARARTPGPSRRAVYKTYLKGQAKFCPKCGSLDISSPSYDSRTGRVSYQCFEPDCGYNWTMKPPTPPPPSRLRASAGDVESREFRGIKWEKPGEKKPSHIVIGKKMKKRIMEVAIFAIAGAISIMFGYVLFGIALLMLMIYVILPDELDVMEDVARGTMRNIKGEAADEIIHMKVDAKMGLFATRGFIKLFAFILAAMEFYFVHQFVSLIILFIGYFSMKTSYDVDKPWEAMQAWLRPIFGIAIAVLFFYILSLGTLNILDPSVAILCLSMAFFVTMPVRKEVSGTHVTLMLGSKNMSKAAEKLIGLGGKYGGNAWFITWFVLAGIAILTSFGLSGPGAVIILVIYVLSFFMGIAGGSQARPYIGMIMMVFVLIAFSAQFSGTIGTAMFGTYWPPVESALTATFEPVSLALEDAQAGIQKTIVCATDPTLCYFLEQEERRQRSLNEGGTVKALEAKITLLGGESQIDPQTPIIGDIEIVNRGEYPARNLGIILQKPMLRDPVEREYDVIDNVAQKFTSCGTGAAYELPGTAYELPLCVYENDVIYPNDRRDARFIYENDDSLASRKRSTSFRHLGSLYSCTCNVRKVETVWPGDQEKTSYFEKSCADDLNQPGNEGILGLMANTFSLSYSQIMQDKVLKDSCDICLGVGDLKGTCPPINTPERTQATGYIEGGKTGKIGILYMFDYAVNVSLSLDIYDEAEMRKFYESGDVLREKISKYSGGPVTAIINIGKQPVREGDLTFGIISISNDVTGTVTGANYTLYIPTEGGKISAGDVRMVSQRGMSCKPARIAPSHSTHAGDIMVQCTLTKDLERGQAAEYRFEFDYDLGGSPRQSTIWVGDVTYTFKKEAEIEMSIVRAPVQ